MTANRISPDPDRTWVDEILRFTEPVGYGPTTLLLRCFDRITNYGYYFLEISTIFSQGKVSVYHGSSISLEGFLSFMLLLVVIIVMVVIVVVILIVIVVAIVGVVIVVMIFGVVVVVDDVSLIFKLSFVIIGFLHIITLLLF
ncbi:hypothetical protein Tco_0913817 [Tanacetum coccineum]